MGENVTLSRDGAIATVTLNRPDRRSSLSDPMLTELAAAFTGARDDARTRLVIAEAKARIDAIARTGLPDVNAVTEGFLDRG